MKPIELFMQFFRREGWVYAIGLTMLIAIDIAFLFVPQFIGNAIDTLSHNKEGLVNYIIYFILLFIIITILKVISRRTLLGSIRRMEYLFREILCRKALQVKTTYYEDKNTLPIIFYIDLLQLQRPTGGENGSRKHERTYFSNGFCSQCHYRTGRTRRLLGKTLLG